MHLRWVGQFFWDCIEYVLRLYWIYDIRPVYVFLRDSSDREPPGRETSQFSTSPNWKVSLWFVPQELEKQHVGAPGVTSEPESSKNPPHWSGDDAGRNKVTREGRWKKAEKTGSTVSTTPTVPLHLVVVLPGSDLDVNPWTDLEGSYWFLLQIRCRSPLKAHLDPTLVAGTAEQHKMIELGEVRITLTYRRILTQTVFSTGSLIRGSRMRFVRPHTYDACLCLCFCFSVSVANYPWWPAVVVFRHGVASRWREVIATRKLCGVNCEPGSPHQHLTMQRSFDVWNFLPKIYSFQCSQVPSPLVLRVVIMVRHMRHLAARCFSCSPTLSHTCWCVSSSLAAHIFRSFFRDRMCHQLVTLCVFSQNDPAHSQAWSNLNYGEKDSDIICSDCSAFSMVSESLFPLRPAWIYIIRSFLGNDASQFLTEES
jgi:hypothetical protein